MSVSIVLATISIIVLIIVCGIVEALLVLVNDSLSCVCSAWSLSIADTTRPRKKRREVSLFQRLICTQKYTIGTSETVLIREVSLFQRLICTQKYTIGTSETVLIREVSLFQRLICTQKYTIGTSETVLIREVSLFQRCLL